MVPACFPSKISSTTGLREAVVYALSSVTGLVRWTDYIPVKLVASADAALEGRTDAGGFIPMDMLSSNTGLMGWVDYLPVYVDNSATDAWAITATGFIPYAASGGISVGGVSATPVFYDTFTDANSTAIASHTPDTTIAPGWTSSLGTWVINNANASWKTNAGDSILVGPDAPTDDYQIEVTLNGSSDGTADGPIFRMVDVNNFYGSWFDGTPSIYIAQKREGRVRQRAR